MKKPVPKRKNSSGKRLDVRNCICGLRPELNRAATAGMHPDRFQLKAGVICLLIVMAIVYIVNPWWALVPLGVLTFIALLALTIKRIQRHSWKCAARDGFLIAIAFFANVLEALNPGNWI